MAGMKVSQSNGITRIDGLIVPITVTSKEARELHAMLGDLFQCGDDELCPCLHSGIDIGHDRAVETVSDWYEPEPPEREAD